ncbi:MAG: hypothetical protein LUD81_00720 [Clostridiales bacterium]|nr:hypothetical protein [Clostridiales bacterium]
MPSNSPCIKAMETTIITAVLGFIPIIDTASKTVVWSMKFISIIIK